MFNNVGNYKMSIESKITFKPNNWEKIDKTKYYAVVNNEII